MDDLDAVIDGNRDGEQRRFGRRLCEVNVNINRR